MSNQKNMERIEEQLLPDGRIDLVKIIEATVNVSKPDVENYGSSNKYTCQCFGHYNVVGSDEPQKLISTKSSVQIACKYPVKTDY